jgi:cytosine/adenosine deaminase-related metal-dependent hydrolase
MIVRSQWFIDWSGRIIEDAEIAVEGKHISAIWKKNTRPAATDSNIIDLGRAVLLPGLVNAHSHLELSLAQSQVKPPEHFTDWIRQIVQTTRGWNSDTFNSSLAVGIKHSVESGTTSFGDISRQANNLQEYSDSNLRVRLFHEVIDFNPQTAEQTFDSLKARIDSYSPGENVLVGIAPHTPYTVSEELLRRCIKLAHENEWRLCIHLAETTAELEFLRSGTGEILRFRKDFGLPTGWEPPRTSPVRYLERLGFFERPATLVHCNYVDEQDFDIIARSDSSVVFCPRSHRYFRHRAHPFLKMIDYGINVALGTDSLASSPSLSMLDEMAFLRKEYPKLEPALIVRMATTNGLKALGLPYEPNAQGHGRRADFVAVSAPLGAIEQFGNPLDILFSKSSKVVFSMVGGEMLLNASIG